MTSEREAMVAFLRGRYAEGIRMANDIAGVLATQAAEGRMGLTPAQADTQARHRVHAAETRARFFEETVIPYLGTDGPTGQIAELQLHLLVDEHRGTPGHDEHWRLYPLP
ncbi:hypothetical protein ACN6LC_004528 [Streptomyces violaceoruber]|uniref:hypothetical protein n=1 Tax=Streptomyces violaceoruber group TaxID=2867121 RepID=UPI0033F95C5C